MRGIKCYQWWLSLRTQNWLCSPISVRRVQHPLRLMGNLWDRYSPINSKPLLKGSNLNFFVFSRTFSSKLFASILCLLYRFFNPIKLRPLFIGTCSIIFLIHYPFMVIIRYFIENDNLVEPSTRDKRITLWNHYYRNARHPYGKINYILVELGMFDICESSISSDSGSIDGSDNESLFSYVLSWNKKIMVISDTKPKDVRDFDSIYIFEKNSLFLEVG